MSLESSPKVTVVLPTSNRGKILPRAVRSVLAQTYSDWELIVVDDGSTDSTPRVIAALTDPRIRSLRRDLAQVQGNPDNPRNLGIKAARGEYLCFLDDDDTYRPEFLERLVGYLEANAEIGLVYCDSVFHRQEGGREIATVNRSVDFDAQLLKRVNYVNTTELMVRRECVGAGWQTHIQRGSDRAFVLQVSERHRVAHLPEALGDKFWGREQPCQPSQHYWDPDFVSCESAVLDPNAMIRRTSPRDSPLSFVTHAELCRDTIDLSARLPRGLSAVYGVPRSGLLPASMIAAERHLPLGVVGAPGLFAGSRIQRFGNPSSRGPVLLVDDSLSTGGAMDRAARWLAERGVSNVLRCALYVAPGRENLLHYSARVVPAPRIFRWNLWGTVRTQRLMCDLDGVLCADPRVFDDDGPEYQEALRTASPLHTPLLPIHSVVTNRLERWREITASWLASHGVQAGSLHMQRFSTAAARRMAGDYGRWKGEVYSGSDALLFVESDEAQARRIHEVSKRPVLSLESENLHARNS